MLKLVDISYGGENGFNQAIELSAEVLSNVKFIQEKKLIGKKSDSLCIAFHSVQKKPKKYQPLRCEEFKDDKKRTEMRL